MRFFQPLSQHGFSRILAETRTHYILSPGLISIEKPQISDGYSSFFDIPFPPDHSDIEKKTYSLKWILPEEKKSKALTNSFLLSEQPFYPSYIPPTISQEDFEGYIERFLKLEEIEKQIFTLPISYFESPLLDQVMKTDCSLYILTGLQDLFNNQRKFTELMVSFHNKLPPDIAIYLPGHISPSLFSFLVYSGIDFFDNSIAYYTGQNGYYLSPKGVYSIKKHPDCFCQYCMEDPPNIIKHNELTLKTILAEIRYSITSGILRTSVEQDIHNFVTFAAALRHYDRIYSEHFQIRTPIISLSPVKCIGEESLFRPEVTEYRKRIGERYSPRDGTNVVVLLPCSARKPYSFSRSHMLFRKALKKSGKNAFNQLSELIVTSPLSVVPRELENIFPARFYDIPVAGIWSNEEIEITASLLSKVLKSYPDDTVIINHTHGEGYEEIVEMVKNNSNFEVFNTSPKSAPTSNDSLTHLTSTTSQILTEKMKNEKMSLSPTLNQLQTIADYQYGIGVGRELFHKPVKIRGKYPRNKQIFLDGELTATLRSTTGFFMLTPSAAQRIVEFSFNNLEFADENLKGSTIYAPGRVEADIRIHPNDEIFIVKEGKLLATATALVSGKDMNKMTSGKLAIINKKLKVGK